jgi:hypothetical protein
MVGCMNVPQTVTSVIAQMIGKYVDAVERLYYLTDA